MKFRIGFFELAFLAEACVPPAPIARGMFWDRLIDEYYYQMTIQEREELFVWLRPKLDVYNEQCSIFYARYNPKNQFRVTTICQGEKEIYECFKWNEAYRTSTRKLVADEFITKVEKI